MMSNRVKNINAGAVDCNEDLRVLVHHEAAQRLGRGLNLASENDKAGEDIFFQKMNMILKQLLFLDGVILDDNFLFFYFQGHVVERPKMA